MMTVLLLINICIRAPWSENYTRYEDLVDLSVESIALRSDSTEAQTDPELHCTHMCEGAFSKIRIRSFFVVSSICSD